MQHPRNLISTNLPRTALQRQESFRWCPASTLGALPPAHAAPAITPGQLDGQANAILPVLRDGEVHVRASEGAWQGRKKQSAGPAWKPRQLNVPSSGEWEIQEAHGVEAGL
jgi:hypothetical protein